jgi:hypothetical protein
MYVCDKDSYNQTNLIIKPFNFYIVFTSCSENKVLKNERLCTPISECEMESQIDKL